MNLVIVEHDFSDTIELLLRRSGRIVEYMTGPVIMVGDKVVECMSRYSEVSFDISEATTFSATKNKLDGGFLFTNAVNKLNEQFPHGVVYLREAGICPKGQVLIRFGVA
jgi:hypothetical protein